MIVVAAAASAAACVVTALLTQTSSTATETTEQLVVVSAIHQCELFDTCVMASASLSDLPVPLLAWYNPSRVADSFDFHAEHIAFLDRHRLLHKNPLPSSALATSKLSPSSPLPPIHFSEQLHRDMASDDDEFFRATHISPTSDAAAN